MMDDVTALVRALGSRRFEACHAATLAALGAPAVLDAVVVAIDSNATLGEPEADGRAVFEDLESCLGRLARIESARFLDHVDALPSLRASFAVVSALTRLDGQRAEQMLAALVTHRSGSIRWLALGALVDRDSPRVVPLLRPRLRDRDGLVVFSAVSALRRLGTPDHLDPLEAIVASPRTAPGTREAALDAIEAIRVRAGLALPPGRPARLFAMELPQGAAVNVMVASSFEAGFVVARSAASPIVAPCAAVVAGIDVVRDAAGSVIGTTLVLRADPADVAERHAFRA